MELSSRIKNVNPSATIALTSRVKQMTAEGIDVVDFGVGEPDFDTPQFIKDAAGAALAGGDTKYAPRSGVKLKAAIARKLKAENGLEVSPEQVLVTFGGKHALYNAFQVLLEPGEKVLTPTPYWVSYPEQVKLAGGQCLFLQTRPENGFKITPEDVLANAAGAKVLLINSPCNPTGVSYTPRELRDIADVVLQTELIVFSDEIYEKLVYGDAEFASFAALDRRLLERTLTFNGLSKAYLVPGFRIGWGVVSGRRAVMGEYLEAINKLLRARLCANHPEQHAIKPALQGDQGHLEQVKAKLSRRRDITTEMLNAIPGISCVPPKGAFYAFPRLNIEGSDDHFVRQLIKETGVVVVPGSGFGQEPGSKHFRVVFLPPEEVLKAAYAKIASFYEKYMDAGS